MLFRSLTSKGHRILNPFSDSEHPTPLVNFYPEKMSLQETAQLLTKNSINYALRGGGIRLSTHAFNTDSEIEKVLGLL